MEHEGENQERNRGKIGKKKGKGREKERGERRETGEIEVKRKLESERTYLGRVECAENSEVSLTPRSRICCI